MSNDRATVIEMDNELVLLRERVRKIDPYSDEWTTGDFKYMTKEQMFKVLHSTISSFFKLIVKLKKKLGWKVFIDDINRKEVMNAILRELQKRFFKKEVISTK